MNDQHGRSARLRYTAAGALAALAAVGAIAGTAALANGGATKTPTSPVPVKSQTSQPGSSRPFLHDVQRLVGAGGITTTEAQAVDREIAAGRIDTDTLAASGFTPAQLQALQQALTTTKRGLAASVPHTSK